MASCLCRWLKLALVSCSSLVLKTRRVGMTIISAWICGIWSQLSPSAPSALGNIWAYYHNQRINFAWYWSLRLYLLIWKQMLYMPLFITMGTYMYQQVKCPYIKWYMWLIFYLVLFLDYYTIIYVYIAYLFTRYIPQSWVVFYRFFIFCCV